MPALVGYTVPDITALRAIGSDTRTDGYSKLVISKRAWYIFNSTATDTADNNNIVSPSSGSGRWFKTSALVLSAEISDLTETIQDMIGSFIVSSSTITRTYNDAGNSISLAIATNSITDSHIQAISISKITNLTTTLSGKSDVGHSHSASAISDFAEAVDDRVAGLLQAGTGISLTYNDTSNTFTISGQAVSTTFKDEGISQGTATSLNVVGALANLSVDAGEATLTINSPDTSIAIYNDSTLVGNATELNFTGSGVSSITLSDNVATIDITGGTSGSSTLVRQNYTIVSNLLAYNGRETLTFSPNDILLLTKISTDYPARVRIYINSSSASTDASRAITTELEGEHGCLFEGATSPSNLTIDLSPPVNLYTITNGALVYVTIDNLDTTSRVITAVLTALQW